MKTATPVQKSPRFTTTNLGRSLFDTPHPAGRKITAGFTYLQNIGRGASYDVWFPEELKRELASREAAGREIGSEQFPAQWAAVREVELLQESGNVKIYDLDSADLKRTLFAMARGQRAGGYRLIVATVGSYQDTCGDELEILDLHLQESIAQMIHMIYLEEASENANAANDARLEANQWNLCDDLPLVGMALGAESLFRPKASGLRQKQARRFFDVLNQLPQKNILHDTVVGLQLPEFNGEYEQIYIARPEDTLASLNSGLRHQFDAFNHISLARLQGDENAAWDIRPSTFHLRGYGDRLTAENDEFFRRSAHLAFG